MIGGTPAGTGPSDRAGGQGDDPEGRRMSIPTPSVGAYVTLSAMLTPALFMTANGSLIISTSNRMSRIVDRIRVMNDLVDSLDRGASNLDYPDVRRAHADEELRHLIWRSDRIRIALTLLYVAFSSFVLTSLSLALDTYLVHRVLALPTFMAVIGVGLMLVSCMNLTREAHRGLQSNRQEVKFHRDLRTRRHTDRG
jgi:hypothetical protein